jgi:hypothetical protein
MNKLLATTALLVGTATAFAPATTNSRTSVAVKESKADLEALAKDLNPLVGFFDPLGLADDSFWCVFISFFCNSKDWSSLFLSFDFFIVISVMISNPCFSVFLSLRMNQSNRPTGNNPMKQQSVSFVKQKSSK